MRVWQAVDKADVDGRHTHTHKGRLEWKETRRRESHAALCGRPKRFLNELEVARLAQDSEHGTGLMSRGSFVVASDSELFAPFSFKEFLTTFSLTPPGCSKCWWMAVGCSRRRCNSIHPWLPTNLYNSWQ